MIELSPEVRLHEFIDIQFQRASVSLINLKEIPGVGFKNEIRISKSHTYNIVEFDDQRATYPSQKIGILDRSKQAYYCINMPLYQFIIFSGPLAFGVGVGVGMEQYGMHSHSWKIFIMDKHAIEKFVLHESTFTVSTMFYIRYSP